MAELFEYLGFGIGFFTLLALIELTLVIVFVVLGIRFLIDVPDYLKDIAVSLRYLRKGNPDSKPVSKVPYIPKSMLFDNNHVYNDDDDEIDS